MRAVIWTDVFQFVVLMGGMLAILIKVSAVEGLQCTILNLEIP